MRINSVRIEVSGMSQRQERRAIISANMALDFFSSDFFKDKLINLDVLSLRGESKNSITKKYQGEALYNLFMSGKEEWNGDVDYEIDLIVKRYRKMWSKVKGYIIPMKPTVFVNAKYFDVASIIDIVSNFCHEYSHTLGCRHFGKFIRESLPYLINEWVEEYFDEDKPVTTHIENNYHNINTEVVCKRVWWKLWLGKVCYRVVS